MKKYIIIWIAGAVLMFAGFMYFSFGGASPDIQKVVSNDGRAELEIPKNALPEGMSIKDISITNVSVDDTTIAYEFKPDGTAFSAGLTFKVTFKNKDSVIPIPFLISKKNGIEPVNGAKVSLNLTKNETAVSLPIAHFSDLLIPLTLTSTFFNVTMEAPAQVYIEDIITAKLTLNKTADSVALSDGALNPWVLTRNGIVNSIVGRGGYRLVRDAVGIYGGVIGDPQIFAPDRIFDNRPPPSAFTGETLTIKSNDYRCDKLGAGGIQFWFNLTYDVTSDVPSERTIGDERISVRKELECVARPSVHSGSGSGVSESESKAVGDIFDEGESQVPPNSAPSASPSATKSPGSIKVCGLPGGSPCPKR